MLRDPEGGDEIDLILLATGSEVSIALAPAGLLEDEGVAARVVSMPCWELFALQPREYREAVLPPSAAVRLAVEAGIALGWERWVGDRGGVVSVEHFGASAPGATLLERFGFTPEAVARRARELLGEPVDELEEAVA